MMDTKEARTTGERHMTREERIEWKREKRRKLPIAGRKRRLAADIPDGFVGHWFNDEGQRLKQKHDEGWDFVYEKGREILTENPDNLEVVVREVVGHHLTGAPIYAYLMVMETDLYNEVQAEKLSEIVSVEAKMKEKPVQEGGGEQSDEDARMVFVKSADFADKAI